MDKVCRHAGHVVRSLGIELWKRFAGSSPTLCELEKRDPPAVWKKNFDGDFPVRNPQPLSTGRVQQPVDNSAYGSVLAGTIDLIIFDGVFDR